MTNTIFFYDTIRDDESVVSATTEDGETPLTSNRYTHQQGSSSVNSDDEGGIFEYSNLKEFSFHELQIATRNFNEDHSLGDGSFIRLMGWVDGSFRNFKGWVDELEIFNDIQEGGFWMVFKGWIDENKLTATNPGEGIPVAIKRLERFSHHLFHGGFQVEVNYLGRLYHPNLVRLLGYCSHYEERLLVYEFMPRGSLADHLFENVSTPLSWSVRMKIALGAAKGLAFLHSAPINVIHRNFKSSIILLDMDYNAKLSGFGLAMDGPTGDESHVSTEVMGTRIYAAPEYISTEVMGTRIYAAPEYIATGHLTAKCDVYAFGVVLLEMLSGRRVYDADSPFGEHYLVEWLKPYLTHKRKAYRMADSRLKGQYSLKGFQKVANLALICLSGNGKSRPNMDEVVKVLGEL